ncbi:MAG: hypothetical protein A2177_15595 [Spirochaetes bacterium RBG_13_68_11]|nr:MAG: hypothetical protein A2177_15595 [Spirochaetes bacterium RBG_13_68_11]
MAKKRSASRSRSTAKSKTVWRVDTLFVLQIVVAVFLITLGLIGVIRYDSDVSRLGRDLNRVFGRANDPFNVIVAAVELAAGILVLAALFVPVKTRWLYWTTLVIAIVWAVRIVLFLFVSRIFEPTFLAWLNQLAADCILLLALWLINRKYA